MNGRAITQLGLVLLGMWVLTQSIWAFLFGLTTGSSEPRSLIPAVVLLGLSYGFVFHSKAIATRFLPEVVGASEVASPDAGRVAVGLLGLFLLGVTIPRLFEFSASILRPELLQQDMAVLQRFSLAGAASQLVLALWLIRRPDQVLALWLPPSEGLNSGSQ